MLPGFHKKKQNSSAHNSNEIEEQTPATAEASTIDTANTINNINIGKTDKEDNDININTIETIAKNKVFPSNVMHQRDNNSDIVDFHTNINLKNETHTSELLPIYTKTMLQMHHAHNEMLNHYNVL